MCVTAGTAALALSAGGMAAKTLGSLGAGSASSNAAAAQAQIAAYQGQVARNNAIIANQQADSEIKVGQTQAFNQSLQNAAKFGNVKTAQAANGIDVNKGTAVDVQASERQLGQYGAETVLSNAQRKAYGYRVQAQTDLAQAGLYDAQGQLSRSSAASAATGGLLSGAGSLLSGASQLPFNWGGGGGGDAYGGAYSTSGGSSATIAGVQAAGLSDADLLAAGAIAV